MLVKLFPGAGRTDERLRRKYEQKVIAPTMTMDIQITSQYPRPNLNEKKSSGIPLPKDFQGLRSPQVFLGHALKVWAMVGVGLQTYLSVAR